MANAKHRSFEPGTQIKLSGKFLAATGQKRGSAGMDTWIVQACDCGLCRGGRFVATNERHSQAYAESMWTATELAAEPSLWQRHIAKESCVVFGQIDIRNCV